MSCLGPLTAAVARDVEGRLAAQMGGFAGAILRPSRRGNQQEKKCGVDQGGIDQDTWQMDPPRSAGGCLRDILQRLRAKTVGQENYNFCAWEPVP